MTQRHPLSSGFSNAIIKAKIAPQLLRNDALYVFKEISHNFEAEPTVQKYFDESLDLCKSSVMVSSVARASRWPATSICGNNEKLRLFSMPPGLLVSWKWLEVKSHRWTRAQTTSLALGSGHLPALPPVALASLSVPFWWSVPSSADCC